MADDSSCGVPVDTRLEFRFDRLLHPSTAVRQSIVVSSGPDVASPLLSPQYDLLERRLTYIPMAWFEANALYELRLPVAAAASDVGLRAFDGAALEAGIVPTRFSFVTSGGPGVTPPVAALTEPTCDDISALLAAHCAGSCCHGGDSPAMGLRLDSRAGLVSTAIERVAHQTETGSSVGVPFIDPARFGVAMPIISAGHPASSYLIYKLLLAAENLRPCQGPSCAFEGLPGARSCAVVPQAERARLAAWFVLGEAMPIVEGGLDDACLPAENRALDCGEMRALTRFIESGARCP